MNLALWICAGLLAAVLFFAGTVKLVVPQERLAAAPGGRWTGDVSVGFVTFLGVVELLGAVGLILPAVLDIAPILVPLAAIGVVLLMTGAMVTHARRGETKAVFANVFYLLLAAFVAWGRLGPAPFT